MKYLQIRNWTTFQQYKDRNPPWIKLHTMLLEDEVFEEMTDFNKLTLILLWLLASRLNNKIPNNPKWLQHKLSLSKKPNIECLYKLKYLEPWDGGEICNWDKRQISPALRKAILEKCGYKCVKCEAENDLEIDHIIPISKGGKTTENNLQALCRSCNRKKHDIITKPPYKPCTDGSVSAYTETEESRDRERDRGETKTKREKDKIRFRDFVFLTKEEYQKLVQRYGEKPAGNLIADLNRYIGQSGKQYKSHYYTLLNFAKREELKELSTPETEKERIERETKAREKRKQEIRDNDTSYFCEQTTEKLKAILNSPKDQRRITRAWLIQEILDERAGK